MSCKTDLGEWPQLWQIHGQCEMSILQMTLCWFLKVVETVFIIHPCSALLSEERTGNGGLSTVCTCTYLAFPHLPFFFKSYLTESDLIDSDLTSSPPFLKSSPFLSYLISSYLILSYPFLFHMPSIARGCLLNRSCRRARLQDHAVKLWDTLNVAVLGAEVVGNEWTWP